MNNEIQVYKQKDPSAEEDESDEVQEEEFAESSFRSSLPSEMIDRSKFSIWSILKQCVDKEIYRFTIPIIWNEPISLLQRMAECMRYAHDLLDKCACAEKPEDRMKYIAAFIVANASSNTGRLSKPFNPLLGETFEFVSAKNAYRICLEQVSHHPPVSAFHAESFHPGNPKWIYHGTNYPIVKLNILHGCLEAVSEGTLTIELPELGEIYTWKGSRIFVHNLIIGKMWFEFSGQNEIINHKLNMKCVLDYKPYSWFTGTINRVEGFISDSNSNKLVLLYGKWDECLYATTVSTSNNNLFSSRVEKMIIEHNYKPSDSTVELIWKSDDSLSTTSNSSNGNFDKQFNFNPFTLKMNELRPYQIQSTSLVVKSQNMQTSITVGPIPPTDSRLRPDMRLYENGQIDEAASEKHRLEEKQREAQRRVEAGEIEKWRPLWFEWKESSDDFSGGDGSNKKETVQNNWVFNKSYWERQFSKCPDIF